MTSPIIDPDTFFAFDSKMEICSSPRSSCPEDFSAFEEPQLEKALEKYLQGKTQEVTSQGEESAISTGVSESPFNSLPHSGDFPSQQSQKALHQGREESLIATFSGCSPLSFSESVESQPEKKRKLDGNQSIYKNKFKESLEQGKSGITELSKCDFEHWNRIITEAEKDTETWREEINRLAPSIRNYTKMEKDVEEIQDSIEEMENQQKRQKAIKKEIPKIKKLIKEFEGEHRNACGRKEEKKILKKIEKTQKKEEELREELRILELNECSAEEINEQKRVLKNTKDMMKPLQVRILDALEFKRYAVFAPLQEVQAELKALASKKSAGFFENYKKQRSMKFFEKEKMSEDELFYWIVIFKVVLTLIPQERDTLSMLTISKETAPFMCWLVDSSVMKVKHKALFKEFSVRMHLRKEFGKTFSKLMDKAAREMSDSRLGDLNRIVDLLGGREEQDFSGFGGSPSTQEFSKISVEEFAELALDFDFETGFEPRKMFKFD